MNELGVLKVLEKYNGHVTIDLLMDELQVSKRTVQYALKELQAMSETYGFKITNKRGMGYMLTIVTPELYKTLMSQEDEASLESLDVSVSCCLVMSDRFITVEELTEIFLVGRTTILNRTESIAEVLEPYDLEFVRKQHYGWRIDGTMTDRMDMLMDHYTKNKWLRNHIKHYVSQKEVVKFESTLLRVLGEANYEINYAELEDIKIWVYIYILIRDYFDEDVKGMHTVTHDDLDAVCQEVFETMQWCPHTNYYKDFKNMLRRSVRSVSTDNNLLTEISEITMKFLKHADLKYQTNFENDHDFQKLLVTHVSLLIDRLQNDTSHTNTLTSEIAFKYPTMFAIALKYSQELEARYKVSINPEEVAFIAAYFAVHMEKESNEKLNQFNRIAVVCGTGGGSAMFIKFKVETFFPNATVQTFSFVEGVNLESFDPNLIFTIKDFEYQGDVPVIKINELVDDVQLVRIQNSLKNNQHQIASGTDDLFDGLLNASIWRIVDKKCQYLNLIENMADELMTLGYAGSNYKDSVLERESYMTTVYVNGVAMPHPMQMNANRNAISVAVVKGDCRDDNDNEVKLVFMMCLNQTGYEALRDITKELYDLMNNRLLVMKLTEVESYEAFRSLIKRRKQWNL